MDTFADVPWYHGKIERERVAELIQSNGEFIVRESVHHKSPSNLILSTVWQNQILHFQINKDAKGYFYFETSHFPTLPALVEFCIQNQSPVTKASGAILLNGVSASKPTVSAHNKPPALTAKRAELPAFAQSHGEVKHAPSKPARVPTIRRMTGAASKASGGRPLLKIRNRDLYSTNDRDYSDYIKIDGAPAQPIDKKNSDMLRFDKFNAKWAARQADNNDRTEQDNDDYADLDYDALEDVIMPDLDQPIQSIDLQSFHSHVLPAHSDFNDNSAVVRVCELLNQYPAEDLARRLAVADLRFLRLVAKTELGLGLCSGLELAALPHGYHSLLTDWLLRYCAMELFVLVTVCSPASVASRADVCNSWIGVAHCLKSNCGDFYAFSAVMDGLIWSQMADPATWTMLQQTHSKSFLLFRDKLTKLFGHLREGSVSVPLSTVTVPYLVPMLLLLLLEGEPIDFLHKDAGVRALLDQLQSDCEQLHVQLDSVRLLTAQSGIYQVNGENLFRKFVPSDFPDELCRTEFQVTFLLGDCSLSRSPGLGGQQLVADGDSADKSSISTSDVGTFNPSSSSSSAALSSSSTTSRPSSPSLLLLRRLSSAAERFVSIVKSRDRVTESEL